MTRAFGLGMLALALTGCGTAQNFARPEDGSSPPLEVYGGVSRSVDTLKTAAASDLVVAAFTPILAIDVGLSAVGDTLTLPVTTSVWGFRYLSIIVAACRGEI